MLPDAVIVAPLLVAATFMVSGAAKLGDDDLVVRAGWSALRVPNRLNTRGLRRAHPWVEVLLGIALVAAPDGAAVAAAAAAVGLCAVYLAVVARAAADPEPVRCACFGTRNPILVTARVVVRNAVLLGLAVVALASAIDAGAPLTALRDAPAATWWWLLAVAVVGVTVRLFAPPPVGTTPGTAAGVGPAVAADARGVRHRLLERSGGRAQLLLFLSTTCVSCVDVGAKVPAWQARVPGVRVRIVVTTPPDALRGARPEWTPFALYDDAGDAAEVLGVLRTPAAVLLGPDATVVGGPVVGQAAIEDLVERLSHASMPPGFFPVNP